MATKNWDLIFTGYEWVDIAQSYGRTPVLLILREGLDKPYIYLCMTSEKAKQNEAPQIQEEKQEQNKILFEKVKTSLRSTSPGRHHCEVKFANYTLNMSHVLFNTFILCKDVVLKFSGEREPPIVIPYGKRASEAKPRILDTEFAVVESPDLRGVIFWDTELDGNIYPGYANTL
ncbi:hypothetical protein FSARC_5281 [Fusarium sarcochroum]|uniref:Uncharacterized protein n=1 Tax=Fusarium sarcochroum TaxID=1208366 RepID=A0A8H4U0B2_9HYPO|nr:hypothetical protein FSARC_5281 [Fusarium sarcochroum]